MFKFGTLFRGTGLNPLQQRMLVKTLGHARDTGPETVLDADDCLRFWVFLLLQRLKFLEHDQRSLLFDEIIPYLDGIGKKIENGSIEGAPVIAVADARYVSWVGYQGWIDLHEGVTIEAPRHPPLETTAYHLVTLFLRNADACRKAANQKSAQDADTSNAG